MSSSVSELKIAVIYHSNYGHTKRVAEAIAQGAKQQLVVVKTLDIHDMDWAFVDSAQMLIFGSAVYMGSVTADFKAFMDETSQRWFHRQWQGKWAAGFANSGGLSGDKLSVLQQICLFAMQHGMNWAGFPTMPTGHTPTDINRLSSFMGLMTQSVDGPPEQTPCVGDIETAQLFGQHLAQLLVAQPPQNDMTVQE
ncbi:flavodoxin family protein [Psychrobacter sp. I-STPA6b]|uniref:flavodoxin family protein n=1 Tax=Psychrobacter sp. I-STPA6b TaxID=2585718 RepID=UPI001D0BF9F2|nr:flavodoxin family protein [Psychrobacter sp. I-STPA6b]